MPAPSLSEVAVRLRPEDNVAVAARPLAPGTGVQVNGRVLCVQGRVGLGHKLALQDIPTGQPVLKYGQIIGFAATDIPAGSHVHVHNVRADNFERDYAFGRDCPPPPEPAEPRTFQGYDRGPERPDHPRYGTRNYIAL